MLWMLKEELEFCKLPPNWSGLQGLFLPKRQGILHTVG